MTPSITLTVDEAIIRLGMTYRSFGECFGLPAKSLILWGVNDHMAEIRKDGTVTIGRGSIKLTAHIKQAKELIW